MIVRGSTRVIQCGQEGTDSDQSRGLTDSLRNEATGVRHMGIQERITRKIRGQAAQKDIYAVDKHCTYCVGLRAESRTGDNKGTGRRAGTTGHRQSDTISCAGICNEMGNVRLLRKKLPEMLTSSARQMTCNKSKQNGSLPHANTRDTRITLGREKKRRGVHTCSSTPSIARDTQK